MDSSDIETKVREHAQRAYILAQMETRPPGYTITAWACVLMDNPYDKLLARFTKRVDHEKARLGADASQAGLDGIFLEFMLPAVPTEPPPELAAKLVALFRAWAKDLAEQECLEALRPFVGQPRSVKVLHAAAAAVRKCLDDLVQVPSFPRFHGKLTMSAQGAFLLTLNDTRTR